MIKKKILVVDDEVDIIEDGPLTVDMQFEKWFCCLWGFKTLFQIC